MNKKQEQFRNALKAHKSSKKVYKNNKKANERSDIKLSTTDEDVKAILPDDFFKNQTKELIEDERLEKEMQKFNEELENIEEISNSNDEDISDSEIVQDNLNLEAIKYASEKWQNIKLIDRKISRLAEDMFIDNPRYLPSSKKETEYKSSKPEHQPKTEENFLLYRNKSLF
ncbi:MAG: hypothetical protein MHPSP_001781 [Paramarteilia canceri]